VEPLSFEEFKRLVVGLFARYPNAQISEATVPAWWAELRDFGRDALIEAFRRAPRGNPQFCPSCEMVREHAAAWRPPTPRADLTRPALPEPPPQVDGELRAEFDAINAKVRAGELDGGKAGAAYLRAIAGRL
jgi:hypothetical protein